VVYLLQVVGLITLITVGALLIVSAVQRGARWSSVVLVGAGFGFYLAALFWLDYLAWGGLVCP
jgi:membrane-associated phospholipid phosphatase